MSAVYFTRDFFATRDAELWLVIQPHVEFGNEVGKEGLGLSNYIEAQGTDDHVYRWLETDHCANAAFVDTLVPVSLPSTSNLRVDLVLGALVLPIDPVDIVDVGATTAAIQALANVPADVRVALAATPPNLAAVAAYLRALFIDDAFVPVASTRRLRSNSPRQTQHARRLDIEAQFKLRASPPEEVESYKVARATRLDIRDSQTFSDQNREPLRRRQVGAKLRELGVKPTDGPHGPFARLYSDELVKLLHGPSPDVIEHRKRIAEQLKLAFWLGTRRFISQGYVQNIDEHVMKLEAEPLWKDRYKSASMPHGLFLTNLHALAGLMVRLYPHTGMTHERLQRVISMQVAIERGNETSWVSATSEDARAQLEDGATREYFRTLSAERPDVALTARVEDLSKRAYAAFGAVGFTSHTETPKVFSRGAVGIESEPLLIRQLIATKLPNATIVGDLTWTPYASYRVDLVRYRHAPMVSGETVLRIVPEPIDAARFFADSELVKLLDEIKLLGFAPTQPLLALAFPWDGDSPTIVTWGKPTRSVRLLVPRGSEIPTPLKTRPRLKDDGNVEFVDEWRSDPFPPTSDQTHETVDLFTCESTDKSADLSALSLSVLAYGRDTFELAAGASRTDLEVSVDYPPSTECAKHMKFDEDVKEDVINYNALNVHIKWDDDGTPVNPWGHVLPSKRSVSALATTHTYQVRHVVAFDGPVTYVTDPAVPSDLKDYFRSIYDRVGRQRSVALKVQHSYGDELQLSQSAWIRTPFDFVPFMPTDVSEDPDASESKFVTFQINQTKQVALRFALGWRSNPDMKADDSKRITRQREVLRALAELGRAGTVASITVDLMAFDVRHAIEKSNSGRLSDGLISLWRSPPEMFTPTQLEPAGEVTIGVDQAALDKCHVVTVTLSIQRAADVVPIAGDYTIVRPSTEPAATGDDRTVKPLEPIKGDPVRTAFESFVKAVGKRTSAIPVAAAIRDRQHDAISRFGFTDRGAHAMVLVEPPPDRALNLTINALAFRPLGSALGAATDAIVEQYFRACQTMIDCAFTAMEKWSWENWTAHFESLAKHRDAYGKIVAGAAATVIPVIPSTAAEIGAYGKHITAAFARAPGQFADTKAYLYLRATNVPPAFAGLTVKATNTVERWNHKVDLRTTTTSFTYLDATLVDNPQALDFLDPLATHSCGNAMDVSPTAFGVERLLRHGEDAPITVTLPTGGQTTPVRLPSRASVTAPIHIFSGVLDDSKLEEYVSQDELLRHHALVPLRDHKRALHVHGLSVRKRIVTSKIDEVVESHLFVIEGDRDVDDMSQAFQSDTFAIDTNDDGNDPSAGPPVTVPKLLAEVATERDLRNLAAVTATIADDLLGKEMETAVAAGLDSRQKPSTGDMSMMPFAIDRNLVSTLSDDATEVLVLETAMAGNNPTQLHPVYLLVRRRASVWKPERIHLRQQRNYTAQNGGRAEAHFDEQFRSDKVDASRAPALRHLVVRPGSNRSLHIAANAQGIATMTVADAAKILNGVADGWKKHELAVTVSRIHRVHAIAVDTGDSQALAVSKFPLQLRRLTPTELETPTTTIVELHRGDYWLDWQWFVADTNAPFFRLTDTEVVVR